MAATAKSSAGVVVVTEVERKFEVPDAFAVPDLSDLPGVAAVDATARHDLVATYFDTPDLRLAVNRITLRRRTGGEDAGWHLKLPRTDGERDELRAPLGRATKKVPAPLREPVEVHLRGSELVPVVRLATTRRVTRLLDADGALLAELAQDDVSASDPAPGGAVRSWQELEVELGEAADRKLLKALVARVRRAGARPSDSPSKLIRALDGRLPEPAGGPAGVRERSGAAVLLDHLAEHIGALKGNDPLVRADADDAVHQMRVAARRLRSALATFRPLLHREVTDPLREELKWLGEVLGAARDAEVTRDELRDLVDAQPAELVLGPVKARIVTHFGARYRAAHDQVLVELKGPRYFALLDALDRLLADPPLTEPAYRDADDVVLPAVARSWKRVHRLAAAAAGETDPHLHDLALHEVRKAAKRARYAGESLVAAYGKPAKRWAKAMEAIQEVLGAHQDSVLIRAELRALGVAAHLDGENGFTYGLLHALEQNRGFDTEQEYAAALEQARDPHLHAWLR